MNKYMPGDMEDMMRILGEDANHLDAMIRYDKWRAAIFEAFRPLFRGEITVEEYAQVVKGLIEKYKKEKKG